ncbi:Phytanoyl-CoA dioxygenase [Thiocapsa sp. KS1]|nr:phytanoyl-CoA dioxygenase family protein [Thiocapsa sp. KS1]CRI64640.1 Phytanoyl-CoA dioxygenase [Thiocapsa sp. KS1]
MQSAQNSRMSDAGEKVTLFEHDGFLGPFDLKHIAVLEELRKTNHKGSNGYNKRPKSGLARLKTALKNGLAKVLKGRNRANKMTQHIGHDQIRSKPEYDLATDPQILDEVADLLGPNILLWKGTVIHREPGSTGQNWHIDLINARVKGVHVSVAITDMTLQNGCLQVIPGTHKYHADLVALAKAGECDLNNSDSMKALADRLHPENAPHKVIAMELKAGQYFFTRGGIWHGVGANTVDQTRSAFVGRYARPDVEVKNFREEFVPSILVRGKDPYQLNVMKKVPMNWRKTSMIRDKTYRTT